VTDLEDRIRESLRDRRRQLPTWPDPMPRIRRAARRQRVRLAAGAGAVTAVIAVGLAAAGFLVASAAGHAVRQTATPAVSCPSGGSGTTEGLGIVAFIRGSSLLVADLATCRQRVVVPNGGSAVQDSGNPSFSPDGRWIVFGLNSVVATAGGPVTSPLGAVVDATWSPTADTLAGVTSGRGVAAGGPGQTRRLLLPDGWGANGSLAFDPTGQQLAVGRSLFDCTKPCPADRGIWVVDLRTGRVHEVYRVPSGQDVGPEVAGWSPDGKWIFFQPDPFNSASIAMDGLPLDAVPVAGRPRPVQVVPTMLSQPLAWCGGRLVVSAGGERFTFHQKHLVAAAPPAWSTSPASRDSSLGWMQSACDPAGTWVAAVAAPNTDVILFARPSELWVLRADGSSAHALVGTGGGRYQMNQPRWSADGRWVLFSRTTVVPRRGSSDLFLTRIDPTTGRALRLVGPVVRDATVFGWYRP
jgi:Tol biopolymer transport system component